MHVKKHHVYVVFRNVAVLRPVKKKTFSMSVLYRSKCCCVSHGENGYLRFSANDHVVAIVRRHSY